MEAHDDGRPVTNHVGGSKRWSAEPQQACLDTEARALLDRLVPAARGERLGPTVAAATASD